MTGIFKINNNEVFGSDGTFSGTIASSATFPAKATDYTHFYHARKSGTAMAIYGEYATANNCENTYAYATGVAPTGFTTIVNMYWWFITENGGTRTYQGKLAWQMGGNSTLAYTHNLSDTRMFENLDLAQNMMARINMLNVGSSGSRFEDLVADGDGFGLRVLHDVNAAVRPLGASITWRF